MAARVMGVAALMAATLLIVATVSQMNPAPAKIVTQTSESPIEKLSNAPVHEALAQIQSTIREHPDPAPLIVEFLARPLPALERDAGSHGVRGARERFDILRDFTLETLAKEERLRNPRDIARLEPILLDVAQADPNLAVARGATQALLALLPEERENLLAKIRAHRTAAEQFAFAFPKAEP